jgi:hypothetical protein
MAKAKKHTKPHTTDAGVSPVATGDTATMAVEIQSLKQQMAKMNGEMETLKKQLSQLVAFIKQKL